ncbi:MAG TPA: amidase [Acidimicrobiia bacterium]|nr:amidase [Acidimicrobiia bacterium]
MTDLSMLDATAQADLVRSGDASPLELVDAAINRVEKLNGELNAVIHPLFERARTAATATSLPDGPFRGVPAVVKDLDGHLAGAPYHGGNKLLREIGYVPDTSSYLFDRLEQAGFVFVGKTNTPEFGLMPTTETTTYGPARNPWNTAHSTGGSSGGSAAAVASGMVPVGHAGDGGGSIRIPAAHCGLFGIKPSRGRISLGPDEGESWGGFVARHVVTRSVRDSAAVLDAIAGSDPGDPFQVPPPAVAYASEVGAAPGSLRIGLMTKAPAGLVEIDDECVAAADDAARLLESLGHTVEVASPPALDEGDLLGNFSNVMTGSLVADLAEVAQLAGRDVTPDDVEPLTWMQYEMGRAVGAGDYIRSIAALHAWSRRIISWWTDDRFDLLLTPTCGEPPPVLGDVVGTAENPLHGFGRATVFAIFTAPFNVTGQPAASVPLYWSASGLPIGVQLVGAPLREDVLFRVAAQLEEARPWIDRRPPVHA